MSASDRCEFVEERQKLIAQVAENLAKCLTSLNALNRHVEAINAIGMEFGAGNKLWSQFANTVKGASQVSLEGEGETSTKAEVLTGESQVIQDDDEE